MNDWREYKLGELVNFTTGKLNSNAAEEDGKYPFFTCSSDPSRINTYAFDTECVLLAGNNANGIFPIFHYKGKFNAYQRTYVITRKTEDLNYKFLFNVIKLLLDFLQHTSHGSVTRFLTLTILRDLPVKLPSVKEQNAISAVLASLDDKIDLLHRQNKTLEALAQTLFRHWFIDGADDDWEYGELGDFVNISYGKNLPTKYLLPVGYPVFGGNGQIGYYKEYLYENPQVLIACRGAASGAVHISPPKSYVTNNSLVLERTKDERVKFEFLKYYALSADLSPYVSGSAQPQITITDLSFAEFFLPSKEKVKEFSEIVKELESKRTLNYRQINTLEKLRDTLLPKLMSGEVRVRHQN